jgi:hypothetical protein
MRQPPPTRVTKRKESDMTRPLRIAAVATALASLAPAVPADEVRHYQAKPSDTFEQAVANFNEYNALMAGLLEADPLTMDEMERIHELTYTIEDALAKMVETLQALPVTLEEVHLASEGDDPAALRTLAADYLSVAQELQ